jgi:hypothetical protein
MSSSTNIQNLLVNVFRPSYTYTSSNFVPTLEISNVDKVIANTLVGYTASIGDANSNTYVGLNAGNAYNNLRSCFNNVAVGVFAGNAISNTSNGIYLGYGAGQNAVGARNVIAIGTNAGGSGLSNIHIGNQTQSTGSNNLLLGNGITVTSGSNNLRIGRYPNIAGDLSSGWTGFGGLTAPLWDLAKVDISGYTSVFGGLGINNDPTQASLNVNGNFQLENGDSRLNLDFVNSNARTEMILSRYDASCNAPQITVDGHMNALSGFRSLTGTIDVSATTDVSIALLQKGSIIISAQDISSTSANYASKYIYVPDPAGITLPIDLATGTSNVADIVYSGSEIQIRNSAVSNVQFQWSVTYFPVA